MNPADIENRIKLLTKKVWGFTIENYCNIKQRSIVGFIFDNNHFLNCFFSKNQKAIDFISENPVPYMDLKVAFYSTLEMRQNIHDFDIFVINQSYLTKYSSSTIDAILIHELCHQIIESNYINNIKMDISEKDNQIGIFLDNYFQRINFDRYHTAEFASLLSYSLRNFNPRQYEYFLTKSLWFNLNIFFDDSYRNFRNAIDMFNK